MNEIANKQASNDIMPLINVGSKLTTSISSILYIFECYCELLTGTGREEAHTDWGTNF